jgi:hypothetical protein
MKTAFLLSCQFNATSEQAPAVPSAKEQRKPLVVQGPLVKMGPKKLEWYLAVLSPFTAARR